jgi:hypothetical protein
LAGIARSQSGKPLRAGTGRGRCPDKAGSQRNIMRMARLPELIMPAKRASGNRRSRIESKSCGVLDRPPSRTMTADNSRHCGPTGSANALPMTGSAKQSILSLRGEMDCFASLAMM